METQDDISIIFKARSSSGPAPHYVEVAVQDGRMFVSCSCPAGRYGKFCEHKMRILQGDQKILEQDQVDDLARVSEWVQRSDFQDLIIQSRRAEKAIDEARAVLDDVKKQMSSAMKDGIAIGNKV